MRSEIMVIPRNDRIFLGRTGTGKYQSDYRNGNTKQLIQYSDAV